MMLVISKATLLLKRVFTHGQYAIAIALGLLLGFISSGNKNPQLFGENADLGEVAEADAPYSQAVYGATAGGTGGGGTGGSGCTGGSGGGGGSGGTGGGSSGGGSC